MMRLLRRLFWLGLLATAGYCAYKAVARRQSQPANAPQWSPLPADRERTDRPAKVADKVAAPQEPASSPWVTSKNGSCPAGYPIKANDSSGIFHVPGGRFYARTVPDRCYATADDAIADGYRAAKA